MRTMCRALRSFALITALPLLLPAPRASAQPAGPPADPADVESVDAIITALYDVISGPVGEERDWQRFGSLFAPDGILSVAGRTPAGDIGFQTMTPEGYWVRNAANLARIGFHENEIGRTSEEFGHVTHVMSAYESLRGDETEPFSRGVNSIQLVNDGERWWIISVLWNSETPDTPIPERYLDGGGGS